MILISRFNQFILKLEQTSLEKGLGWIINSLIDHNISISKYNSLAGGSCIKLPKELEHPRKGLVNIQNIDDNGFFKWCLVRHLNSANHHSAKITKSDKDFAKKKDFRYVKFSANIRDIHKMEKINSIRIVFLAMKINKNIQFIYTKNPVKKKC